MDYGYNKTGKVLVLLNISQYLKIYRLFNITFKSFNNIVSIYEL